MTIVLTAETRTEKKKKSGLLLAADKLPAVVYGPKQEPLVISVPLREFARILREEGESSVIELSGVTPSPIKVLIHDLFVDPVTNLPRHVDLYAIEKGAKVEIAIPLTYVGEAPAVKENGSIVKVLHELEIEAAPENLPHEIEVDVSTLEKIGDQILVSSLKIPAGVTVKNDPEEVVALAQEIKAEEEETAPVDMSAIEVEQKGKTEEEGEAAE